MNVTEVNGTPTITHEYEGITQDALKKEYMYLQSEKLTKMLYESGQLTGDEYVRMIKKLREKYIPIYATIMPEITCYLGQTE